MKPINLLFFFPPFFPSCFLKFAWSAPFLLVFLNFPDPSHQKSFLGNMWTKKYSEISPTALLPSDLLLGEILQNTKRNKKRGFNTNHEFGIPGDSEELPAWWGFITGIVLGDLSIHPPATDPWWVVLHDGVVLPMELFQQTPKTWLYSLSCFLMSGSWILEL